MSDAIKRARQAKQLGEWMVGATFEQAKAALDMFGFQWRVVRIDGEACMITNDCKSDRIGLVLTMGLVTDTKVG